ncbi:MAG: acyl-CoA thioesterase [Desulfurococcales archaeon]|nr:acyl-CoA thioesterase [Desulfurococcales archaeon]
MSERPIYSLEGRVYWSETDAAQIAHFTSFLRYCEKTEEEFVLEITGKRIFPPPVLFPRVHVEIDYSVPLRVHDKYRVDIVDVRVGRKSITWTFKIYNQTLKALAAECKIVTVAFDPTTWTSIEVPEDLRRAIEERAKQNS